MVKIVSIINLKGGVAKTTTTVQLAECLSSRFDKRVLVVDLDPQTNATISLIGEDKWEEIDNQGQTLFHLFDDKLKNTATFDIKKALQRGVSNLRLPSLSLLASSIKFIDIQDHIRDVSEKTNYIINPMEVLKTSIRHEFDNFDYVLVDCPPNLGFITKNGIEISDYYLIPSIPDTLSTYGIPQIVKTIYDFSESRSLKIKCLGLLITKYSSTSNAHRRGMAALPARFKKIFSDLKIEQAPIFDTRIPQANATAEAMDFENSPSTFQEKYGRSESGKRYLYEYVMDLAGEFIRRVEI